MKKVPFLQNLLLLGSFLSNVPTPVPDKREQIFYKKYDMWKISRASIANFFDLSPISVATLGLITHLCINI